MTEADDPFAVLTTPPPSFTSGEVAATLEDRFGLHGDLTLLNSERDQNFRFDTPSGRRYVVKIANAAEAIEVTDFQASALQHIAATDPGFPSPRVRTTLDGNTSIDIEDAKGNAHRLRVLSWLDGELMEDGQPESLAYSMGRCLAQLHRALRDFTHPGDSYTLPWDISNASLVARHVDTIEDTAVRQMCQRHFRHFAARVEAVLGGLRAQVIHNDFNPGNVLVDPADPDQIVGIIDFGDMVRAPLIVDVATAATYLAIGHVDPRAEIGRFVDAYQSAAELSAAELSLLEELIVTRLVVSITIGQWRARQFPSNQRYIMVTQTESIDLLFEMTGKRQ